MGTIDLNRFGAFCAVAELGGFSAAAARLGLPKSSVSRAIGALEAELGVRLFHRTTRRVSLTTSGAALLAQVAPPLEALRRAAAELPERDEAPSGLLRITTLSDLATEIVGEVVARLVAQHPRLDVQLVLTERRIDLVAERIDVALRVAVRPLRDSSLVARRVGRMRMGLYAAPSYLEGHGTPRRAEQLAAHDWATLPTSDNAVGVQTLLPVPVGRARVQCNDGPSLRAILCAGAGIGMLPSHLGERDVESGALVRVLPKLTLRSGDLWLIYPSGRQVPRKVLAFRDELLAAVKRRPVLAA